jgi:hypothetical protein
MEKNQQSDQAEIHYARSNQDSAREQMRTQLASGAA